MKKENINNNNIFMQLSSSYCVFYTLHLNITSINDAATVNSSKSVTNYLIPIKQNRLVVTVVAPGLRLIVANHQVSSYFVLFRCCLYTKILQKIWKKYDEVDQNSISIRLLKKYCLSFAHLIFCIMIEWGKYLFFTFVYEIWI